MMRLAKVIITSEKLCCENCRSNAIEINHIDDMYEVVGCPICHSKVNGITDKKHFWKMGELINQIIEEYSAERFE